MTTTTCTEFKAIETANNSYDIICQYAGEMGGKIVKPVCPLTKFQKLVFRLRKRSCLCKACHVERLQNSIRSLKDKVEGRIVFKRGVLQKVSTIDKQFIATLCSLGPNRIINDVELFGLLAFAYTNMIETLIADPFTEWDEYITQCPKSMAHNFRTLTGFLSREFKMIRPTCYQIHILNKDLYNVLYRRDIFAKENLVGVEHNPGPNTIVQYLKNMEKMNTTPAPTSKRAVQVSKVLKSIEKKREKGQTIKTNNARDLKYDRMFPEGLFELGFDASSRQFLAQLIESFSKTLNINVKHEIDFGLQISQVMGYVRDLGKQAYDFFVAFVKVIVSFMKGAYASLVLNLLGEDFHDAVEMQPEGEIPWLPLMATIYSKHLTSCVFRWDWDDFVRTLGEIRNKSKAGESTLNVVVEVFKETVTLLCDTFSIDRPSFLEENPDVKRIQAEAKSIYEEYRNGVQNDYSFADRVHILQSEMEDLLYEKRKTVDVKTKEKLVYLLKKFQPISNYCMKFVNPNNGPRTEPLAVLIAGPTGVGKSTFTVPFLIALMANILPKDKLEAFKKNHNDFMFFRANENEFWDGYKMRNVAVIYDDFGQVVDSVGNPSADIFEAIRLINTAPYQLHMASLEDKQRMFACPKLVFATTNRSMFHFQSIVCSEAVTRRFHLSYVQVPKPEFCKDGYAGVWDRRLDLAKVRAKYPEVEGDISTFVALDVVEFVPWNFDKATINPELPTLDFKGLLTRAIRIYREKEQKGDKMIKFHKHMMDFKPEGDDERFVDATEHMDVKAKLLESVKWVAEAPLRTYNMALMSMPSWSEIMPVAKGLVQTLCVAVTLVTASSGLYTMYDRLFNKKIEGDYSKASARKGKGRARHTQKRGNVAKFRISKALSAQGSDVNIDAYLSIIKRNMYRLRVDGKEIGWCLFIVSRIFVVPRHFDDIMKWCESEKCVVEFLNPFTGKVVMSLDWFEDMSYFDNHEDDPKPYDYLFFCVHQFRCREHSDITQYFLPVNKPKSGEFYPSQLAVLRSGTLIFQTPNVEIAGDCEYPSIDATYRSRSLYYSSGTLRGDCGSPLVSCDPRFARPTILGIHTAGTGDSSFKNKNCCGVFLYKEEIEAVINAFDVERFVEKIPTMQVESIDNFNTLAPIQQPRMPIKTNLTRTDISKFLGWKPTMKPAYLSSFTNTEGVVIDPRVKARDGYCHDEIYIDQSILEEVFPHVANLVLKKHQAAPWRPRVLDFDEAVKGVPGVEFVDGVNRSTSPGYPYVLDNKMKGKKAWFGDDADYDMDNDAVERLRKINEELVADAINGVRNLHVFIDYLKDEKRPIEKVNAGKTRQIMACGMDYLIIAKRYFGDFIRHVCQNRILNGIAVGVDPSKEWEQIVNYLQMCNDTKVAAGDYSKYDAKIPVPIAFTALRIVEAYYFNATEEDRKVRYVLFHEIINSMHVAEGKLYEMVGGNPSGQPMTAVFNSLCNLVILVYQAFCAEDQLAELEDRYPDFEKVFNNARFQVFGDDNIVSYKPCVKHLYSQAALEVNIPKFVGMDYTNEMKNSEALGERKIWEVSFLKRGFHKVNNRVTCPLELSVIKETLHWQKKNPDLSEMKLRIECVLSELARHGREIFNQYGPQVVRASLEAYSYQPKNASFEVAFGSFDCLAF